ncbi:HAMP domain-containing sensor histidine kinase [Bacillus thuringiensis]|uniref:histidine kinase n=1 Tax=Bacillus thuringiensis TaxID=1428 RepID=A0A9X6WPZ9_BACTU|nr:MULTISPECIES: HAMP domain-containing sensor histidine kinase [Bacillus]KXY65527.1 histidine kinase [Bacillus cereus]KAB2374256.1 HAMP domain-containing histidine kinase [Bacillus sp. RM2(2019)]MBK5494130.1 HAMP domain-containing histidine kinase [Bacillus sp. TH13]MCC6078370.1 HAMP domain-containing histidine kinase [Bacillus thuringiensis]MED3347287.1 HAMP domain-containing sensor histidine kinase [Bacillus thuringiensis]
MSIKTRFLFSYIAVILVSITLILVAGFLIVFSITGDLEAVKNFYKSSYIQKPLTPEEENAYLELKLAAKQHQSQLLDESFVSSIEKEGVKIIVRKGENISYANKGFESSTLTEALPKFEAANINSRGTTELGDTFYRYVKFDFYFPEKEEGSIFVLKKQSSFVDLTQKLFPILFVSLLLLAILLIGLLSYLVSRSVIKPIFVLKGATEKIKEGNLDFQIPITSHDEIGQLNQGFEEMRKRLKESIEMQTQYEENRKELISNISHDLKTPITSIIGYVEGIKDGVANTPEKMDKYLTTIHTKAKHMDTLIDELFLFSKLDLNRVPFQFETVELNTFMQELIEEMQMDLSKEGIEVNLQLHASTLYVTADCEKINRVISNLIHNSVKYMDKEEKKITVTVSSDNNKIIVKVMDNGSGIEADTLPYIFERFYRAEQSRNSSTGGSGLGLAIAKQIVEEHGGEIWAESELGKGTSIFFSLEKVEECGE